MRLNVFSSPVGFIHAVHVETVSPTCADSVIDECWTVLASIQHFYPGFRRWYYGSVVPGLRVGKRQISIIRSFEQIVAVGIAKNYETEKKLCTVWVDPSARGRGNGARIIDQSLKFLETDCPLITVPEEKDKYFLSLMQKYGFEKRQSIFGLYRPNAIEFIYNNQFKVSDEDKN